MKKEDKKKLRQKTIPELETELEGAEKELVEAKIKLSKGQLENVRYPAKLRNKIAVIKTIISQKEDSAKQNIKENE